MTDRVVYAPLLQELACVCSSKFRPTICRSLVRDAECGKGVPQAVNQSFRSLLCAFDNGPVGEAIYHDKVVDPFVVEEVGTDALEGVCWGHSW